jgi:hypothetical protein
LLPHSLGLGSKLTPKGEQVRAVKSREERASYTPINYLWRARQGKQKESKEKARIMGEERAARALLVKRKRVGKRSQDRAGKEGLVD